MYTLPEIGNAADLWWQGLARHLAEAGVNRVPRALEKPTDLLMHWLDVDLLFSQTCGYPLTHLLDQRVALVATPTYDAPGCDGVFYRSMIVVRDDLDATSLEDLHQCDVAINSWDSQSGFNALRARMAGLTVPGEQFFGRTLITTSHARSIAAVCAGEAQCAAVDAVTLALFHRHRPDAVAPLRVLDQTGAAPGLPYITRRDISTEEMDGLRHGLFSALADPALEGARADLLLTGAEILEPGAYDVIHDMENAGKDVIL